MKQHIHGLHMFVRRVKKYTLYLVFAVLAIVIFFADFPATNVQYSVTFDQTPTAKVSADFIFDDNQSMPSAARQTATLHDGQASIRLDPLNSDSKHLKISTSSSVGLAKQFRAEIIINGKLFHTISTIPKDQLNQASDENSTSIKLSTQQLASIQQASHQQSEIKFYVLIALTMLFLLVLLRRTWMKRLSNLYFCGVVAVSILCTYFFINLWCNYNPLHNSSFPYQSLITASIATFTILIMLNCNFPFKKARISSSCMSLLNYVAVFAYAVCQFPVYIRYIGGFPDEQAHLSYIAYLRTQGNAFVPDFSNMQIYNTVKPGVLDLHSVTEFNYLGHPPLYYWIMNALGRMEVSGNQVLYHINIMRLISFGIGLIGVLLIFYLGYTRIAKIPMLHLLFAVIVISPPNLLYGMSGLNNDSLTILTFTIFIWGIIRFIEKRYTYLTFVLIAVGMSTSLLTKITTGMVAGAVGIGVLMYTLIHEKQEKLVFNKPFFAALPIYLVPVAYFSLLYAKFHTIQPSYQKLALAEYLHSPHYVSISARSAMSVPQYVLYFSQQFFRSWYEVSGHLAIHKGQSIFNIDNIGLIAIIVLPLLVFCWVREKNYAYISIGVGSITLVALYQAWSALNGYNTDGYPGGFQSRYYLCTISVLAFAIISIFSKQATLLRRNQDSELPIITNRGKFLASIFVLLLVFDGFIYSVLIHMPELPAFA